MKKLYIAIASASAIFAASAQAETVVESGELTLDIESKVEVAYMKDRVKDADGAITFNNVDFMFAPTYETESGVKALSYVELNFYTSDSDNAVSNATKEAAAGLVANTVDKAYVGLNYMDTTLTIGKQTLASDEFGIGQDYDFGVNNVLGKTEGSDVIKVAYEQDAFNVYASLDVNEKVGDTDETSDFDIYADFTVTEGVTAAATYQNQKVGAGDAVNFLGASAQYDMAPITVGAEFTYALDAEESVQNNQMAYQIAGVYAISDAVNVAAGFGQVFNADSKVDAVAQYYINADYAVASNATIYAEVGGSSADNAELGYTAGMTVEF